MKDDGLKGARYSEVERRLWNDSRFRTLSPIPPCGQGLWLYLLTTPELGPIPGLIVMGESAMAEHLEWPLKAFREAFAEVFAEGMAKANWKARLVVVPKAVGRRPPASPNVIISWRQQWIEAPDCDLKVEHYQRLKAFTEGLGKGFREAFAKAIANPSPNQDQDQDQDQEKRKSAGASAPDGTAAAAPPGRERDPDPSPALAAIRAELERHPRCRALPLPEVTAMLEQRFQTLAISKGTKLEWYITALGEAADDGVALGGEALTQKLRKYGDCARAPRADTNGSAHSDKPKSYESPPMSKEQISMQKANARRRADHLNAVLEGSNGKK